MDNCKHENAVLLGTSDGIVCRRCGALFADFAELERSRPVEAVTEAPAEAPKRTRKKKGA